MEIKIEIKCSCGKESVLQISADQKEYICDSCGVELFKAHISTGYIYILSNPSMPNLLKIGFTERNVDERVEELNSTGVPVPFEIEAIFGSPNAYTDEQAIHELLNKHRLSSNREFFSVDLKEAVQCIIDCIGSKPSFLKSPEMLMNKTEQRLYQKKLRKQQYARENQATKQEVSEKIDRLEEKRDRLLKLFDNDILEAVIDHAEEEVLDIKGLCTRQIESFVRWSVNSRLVSYLLGLEDRSFSKNYLESFFEELESLRAEFYQYKLIDWDEMLNRSEPGT